MADDFEKVRVARAWDEGPQLRALALDTGTTGFAAKHAIPGQYVRARLPGEKEAFLAIASAPGSAELELLLQKSAPGDPPKHAVSERSESNRTVDKLAALSLGDSLEISAPAGKGYPIEAERGRDVLLFAGGSGISAIRSLAEWIAAHRADFGRVVLLFGARTPEDLAYRSMFERWGGHRIEVVPVLSRAAGGWTGRTGYVPAALPDCAIDPKNASAFVTGGKAFDAGITEALGVLGITRIFRNF